jgi:hypothetical protein
MMYYDIADVIAFFFLSFPKFHSVVPLLQTCSTYMFVYERVTFFKREKEGDSGRTENGTLRT